MLKQYHENKKLQHVLGLLIGVGFGFFLQKGGVTSYDVIIGQLLLNDFTVIKVMITAVIVGMLGIHLMRSMGLVSFHTFQGSLGASLVGGILFGIGFGLLGYCPGTVAGAIGQGQIDALVGGAVGILIGMGLFAHFYPAINRKILPFCPFPVETIPELLHMPRLVVVAGMIVVMTFFLWILETSGF